MSGGKPVLRDAPHRSAPGSHADPSRQSVTSLDVV